MKSFTNPSFQDRLCRAAEAKEKALGKLRARPPVDEKLTAERLAAQTRREAAAAEKRAAKLAAEQAAKEAAIHAASEAEKEAAAAAPVKAALTDEERKLARDARYAARKKRR